MQKTPVDIVIIPKWLVPIRPDNIVLTDHALVIDQGKIIDLLAAELALARYAAKTLIERPDHVLMPGLVNAHTHSAMSLMRGIADDLPLMTWLNEHIWPAEQRYLSGEFVRDGTELAMLEMIRSGTTCFNDHYYYPDVIADTVINAGMRAGVSMLVMNLPTAYGQTEQDYFDNGVEFFQAYQNHPLIKASLGPAHPFSTSDDILLKISDFSSKHDLPIYMHVHETIAEVEQSLSDYGKRPLKRLYDLGLLAHHFEHVHMTQVNMEDLDILKETSAHIVHCPASNMKLNSGNCPVQTLLHAGINVALGTDGAASNNGLDMFMDMHLTALLGKIAANDSTAVTAETCLEMATINGANCLGLGDQIGSLEVGKQADMITVDLSSANTQPIYNPLSHLVYAANSRQVNDVWVSGKPLLNNGLYLTLDEESIINKVKNWQEKIHQ